MASKVDGSTGGDAGSFASSVAFAPPSSPSTRLSSPPPPPPAAPPSERRPDPPPPPPPFGSLLVPLINELREAVTEATSRASLRAMLAVGAVAALTAAFDGPAATLLRVADRYELFPREEEVRYRYVLKWEPVHAVGTFFAFMALRALLVPYPPDADAGGNVRLRITQ